MWPWAMALTLDFQSQIFKESSSHEWDGQIDMEQKGCELIGSRTHFVALKFYPPWPWPWIVKVKFWNSCMPGKAEMQVNRKSDPLCDLELWPWLWIFKVKYLKISGLGGLIDLEWNGCVRKRCWTHNLTLSYDLDLVFFKVKFKKKSCISRMEGSIDME